jgi:serine/threonine-protein kinase HipA
VVSVARIDAQHLNKTFTLSIILPAIPINTLMPDIFVLNVFLHDQKIGTISADEDANTLFRFNPEYVENHDRPTLSLSMKNSQGGLITHFKQENNRLPPFFSNLLPEERLRHYLAKRAKVSTSREFCLLWVLGQNLPGALRVTPTEETSSKSDQIDDSVRRPEEGMGFSLSGIQTKFSGKLHPSSDFTIAEFGEGGNWIVKLPSDRCPSLPENEFSMMEMARQLGIDVPETRLLSLDQISNIPKGIDQFGHLAVAIKRFDRADDGTPIHTEDFAQVLGVYPEHKYQHASLSDIAKVIGREAQQQDVEQFIRRLVFNILIGNADMHLKDWSLIYKDQVTPSIAPAYGFISTISYAPSDNAALNISRSSQFSDCTLDELSHLATSANLPEKWLLDIAQQTVFEFHDVWQCEKHNFPVSEQMIEAIERHLHKVPLAIADVFGVPLR